MTFSRPKPGIYFQGSVVIKKIPQLNIFTAYNKLIIIINKYYANIYITIAYYKRTYVFILIQN